MNSYVIIDGSTSANNNPVSQDNRTCEATMARHNTRSSQNTIMRDLDQVVYFTTIANYCRTKLSAVNTGICTYLHSVSNTHIDMKNTKIPYFATFPNYGSRPNNCALTNFGFVKNCNIRI